MIKQLFIFLLFLSVVLKAENTARALGIPTIRLTASRYTILNNGKDATEIIAEPRDSTGSPMPEGSEITFNSNLGTFAPASVVRVQSGIARVRLSSQQKGTATVRAITTGGGFAQFDIQFTDDPAETFQGNVYVNIQSTGSLLYSAGDRIIEAIGRTQGEDEKARPGALITYRGIEVIADSLQIDCQTNTLRARGHVTARVGKNRMSCNKLYLPLLGGDGFAIADVDNRLGPVKVLANSLKLEPMDHPIPPRYLQLEDLAGAKLAITARQIMYFPGQKLQFKRPRFYQDGQLLVSMAFYQLGLYSTAVLSDQFMSLGTTGLSMDIPIYYDLTPGSTGIFHVRHGEKSGRSSYAFQPGWSLDLVQSYATVKGSSRYTGEMGLTGVSGNDWGFRWSHSQEFDQDTRATLFLDTPQHKSVIGAASVMHQFGALTGGLNFSANRSMTGIPSNGMEGSLYLETIPRKMGKSGYMMAIGATSSTMSQRTGDYQIRSLSQDLHTRFYSNPFKIDKKTTVSNYMTVGQAWNNTGSSGLTMLTSITANHSIRPGANLNVTYDYSRESTTLGGMGNHRLSANFLASAGNKWSMYLYHSRLLDGPSSSTTGDFNFTFAPRWRMALTATMQQYSFSKYQDIEMGIARSIGGRDLVISYSTYNHRIFFNIEASRF